VRPANPLRPVQVFLTAMIVLSGSYAGAVTVRTAGPFSVSFYHSGEGDGSNSSTQNWTTQQMDDVVASIQVWYDRLADTAGRQANLHMFWYNYTGSTLGATFCPTNGSGGTSWTYVEHVWRDGVNYSAPWSAWDGYIKMDTDAAGYSWNFGTGNPSSSQIDFRSVITHELGHAVGFYDSYNNSLRKWGATWGTSSSPTAFAGYNGISRWDANLRDDEGDMPNSGGTGTPGKFDVKDNPVHFVGANASAYNGGSVAIYAPNPYAPGSSLSHLDYSTFPDALMSPFFSLGDVQRWPTELEWQVMKDIGWTVLPLGDANRDGEVGLSDFTILKANFGSPGGWTDGDFNNDYVVNLQDFTLLKDHFGQGAALALTTLPEPATLVLLGAAVLPMLSKPRRRR